MITLYAKDVAGGLRVWTIEPIFDEIVITHGVYGGVMQEKRETVSEGKAGRSLDEQIDLQINSRISRQQDKGYVFGKDEAMQLRRTSASGFLRPMLAMPFNKIKRIEYRNAYMQYKYDGNRCMITCRNGKNIAYSRNGKKINIPHITGTMVIPEGVTIDGELYCHGEKLQTIVSWVKRHQENTKRLRFHMYDAMLDKPYHDRLGTLSTFVEAGPSAEVVPTHECHSEQDAKLHMAIARDHGYEGAIIRQNDFGYEDGKRSKSLIKMKAWLDAECQIVDIHASKDNWAILECEFEGKRFRVSAPGSMADKELILDLADEYIGLTARVEYSMLTADGVPFHPVAVAIV